MKNIILDERLMLKVSDMYYNQDMVQAEIAKKLGISRPTVSKLLQGARKAGIVTIKIEDPSGRTYFRLEQQIEEFYGLKEVLITPTGENEEMTLLNLGKGGAHILQTLIQNDSIVGISLGSSLQQVIQHVEPEFLPGTQFVPLIGGLGIMPQEIQSNFLAEQLAKNYSGQHFPFYASAMVTDGLRDELLKDPSITRVFKKANKMDIALIGIGAMGPNSTLLKTGYLSVQDYKEMEQNGVCGDILMRFFDANGEYEPYELSQKVFSFNPDRLKKIPHSIGICMGTSKIKAIRAAIHSKLINTLVTDYETAQSLLESDPTFKPENES